MKCVPQHLSSPIQQGLHLPDLPAARATLWDVVGTIGSLRVTLRYDRCGSLPRWYPT